MSLAKRQEIQLGSFRASAETRLALSDATDSWLRELAKNANLEESRIALVAVGGYGRQELCAFSDLDVLMLHQVDVSADLISEKAQSIWYPIWDAGVSLDHSVRDLAQVRRMANKDFKVVLGLLDARLIVGDESLLSEVRSSVLSDWRSMAKDRLQLLQQSSFERKERFGELSYLLEPDLKESFGGLRESTILRAIAASWITDVNKEKIEVAHQQLLDIRDTLHRVTGKPNDRLSLFEQDEVAELLNFSDADELLKRVYESGRTLAFESDGAWSRVAKVLKPRNFLSLKKIEPSRRAPLANGVVVQDGEVVLARDANASSDDGYIWRIAAAAAQAGLQISPSTIKVLTSNPVRLVTPWSAETLNDFVSFLGAGQPMLSIWEALDQAGLIEKLIPHWSAIRFAPQRNALHIYTVDRHSVECAIEAAKLTRKVSRPDLLLVGSLFHDIGKARGGDHSMKGSELMAEIAPQIGFNQVDSQLLQKMVELHLLLPEVAARRDLDDIETINFVADKIDSKLLLELLHNLTIADSKATSSQNWSDWKANLIQELVDRVSKVLDGKPLPSSNSLSETFPIAISEETKISLEMSQNLDVHVMTKDRIGLVADVAAAFRILKLEVLAAQFETKDGIALQHWKVRPLFGLLPDAKQIEFDVLAAINNSEVVLKQIEKLVFGNSQNRGFVAPRPVFYFVDDSGTSSDILEVRAHDEPALLFRLSQILVKHRVTISAARIDTIGSEVIDVLYLQNTDGSKLNETQKAAIIADIDQELVS